MKEIYTEFIDWSEVWALLIPLTILLFYRKQPRILKPVIIYIWLALLINLAIDVSWKLLVKYKKTAIPTWIPAWFQSNNYMYNIHSIVRFICFTSFFIMLNQ